MSSNNDQQDGIFGYIIRKCSEISERMPLKGYYYKVRSSDLIAKLLNTNINDDNRSKDDPEIERGDGHFIREIYCGWVLERTSRNASNYRLRNPTSRRVLDLPDTGEKEWSHMLPFYLSSRKTFKMIFPFPDQENGYLSFKVLTIGLNSKWRRLNFTSKCKLTNAKWLTNVFFGNVYVIVVLPTKGSIAATIVCLEAESEKIWSIRVSKDFTSSGTKNIALVKWDGKLALARKLENDLLYVCVVEDYKTQKWAEERIVVDLTYMEKDVRKHYTPYCFSQNVLWMHRNFESSLTFDIVSKGVTYLAGPKKTGRELCSNLLGLKDLEGSKPLDE